MGVEFDINMDLDEDELRNAIADQVEELAREWVENEVGNGHLECDCGSRSFDVETWQQPQGQIEAAAVCRECNERMAIDLDTAEIDELRK